MTEESKRQEFEEWVREHPMFDLPLKRDEDCEGYLWPRTRSAFAAYRAGETAVQNRDQVAESERD